MIGPEASQSLGKSPQDWGVIKRVSLNTAWLTAARLGSQFLLLLFTILVARRMGETGLGGYAYMGAVIFIGNVFSTFGTDMLLMREVAARRDFSLLSPAAILQLALSAFFVGLVLFFFPLLPGQGPQFIAAVKLYSLALFPLAIYTICSAVLRGMEFMQPYMWLNLLLAGLQASLAWWLIRPDSSFLDLSWILLTVQLVVALLAVGYCRLRIPGFSLIRRFSYSSVSNLFLASAPLAIVAIVKILYQKITLILLSHLQGISDTGWFSAAMRTVEASQFVHIALLGALFPIMSFAFLSGSQVSRENRKALAASWWFLLAVGISAAVLLFFFSTPLISLVFGEEFTPSILALRILAWLMIPFSINIFLSALLISARQERLVLTIFLASLVILVMLDLLLIPAFGLVGACIAALVSESIQAVIFIYTRSILQRTR